MFRDPFPSGIYDDPAARRLVSDKCDVTIADLIRFPQWMLFGHAFSHTFTHHDSAGLSTYVVVVDGRKLWFILMWTVQVVTPELWLKRWADMRSGALHELEYRERPIWVLGEGEHATIDLRLYNEHKASWENRRVAEWVCADLTPGTCL